MPIETGSPNEPDTSPDVDRRRERGTSLVEAAVVLPIILLVVLGTIEIGIAFKDFLTVGAISREGARVGAVAGNDGDADCAILKGIGSVATSGDLARITNVQIYKAAEGTGTQQGTNTWVFNDGNDPMQCNVPAQVGDGWSRVGPEGYPALGRNTTIGSTPLDIVGVRVQLNRDWITGFPPFRGSFTIDETTITRLEPEAFE